MNKIFFAIWAVGTLGLAAALALILGASPTAETLPAPSAGIFDTKHGDQELAYLLVKLELRTRATIYAHYTRPQSVVPGPDIVYRRWLAKNALLPAAVADRIFSDVVPGATGNRAWVKMVVQEPRNPHNVADATARALLQDIRNGAQQAEKQTASAYYYAEPIKATEACMHCHGEPRGKPDPIFPQYKFEGWKTGDVIGAVVARVEPDRQHATAPAANLPPEP